MHSKRKKSHHHIHIPSLIPKTMECIISLDTELSGPLPEKHSILSLGACIVGSLDSHFYREMQPLSLEYEEGAMRIATRGLHCIPPKLRIRPEYHPRSRTFRPELIIRYLQRHGAPAQESIEDFAKWIKRSINSKNIPLVLAKPLRVDIPFIKKYFETYNLPWPFVGEIDLEQSYHSLVRNTHASLNNLQVSYIRGRKHNALEDAMFHAEQYRKILQIRWSDAHCQ